VRFRAASITNNTFFISSLGMAIGYREVDLFSRGPGAKNQKSKVTFANQMYDLFFGVTLWAFF
jgi:hypothetical protein